MKIIPTKIHGIIDYVSGLILILTPVIFGFAELTGAPVLIPRILGVTIIIMSLLTRYEVGLVTLISFRIHLAIDYIGGFILATSPWFFGFSSLSKNVWLPHLFAGIILFAIALISETRRRKI
jgi:hypothetical protein